MRKIVTLFTLLITNLFYSQEIVNLNHESTKEKNYFTTFNYEELNGKMIVSAELNSKKYNFVFDTGAPTAISSKIVSELKLSTDGDIELKDQSALTSNMEIVTIENLNFGGINFKNTPSIILKDMTLFDCLNVDGIIGSNILGNSIIQISAKDKTITLTDKADKLKLKKKNSFEMTVNPIQSTPYIDLFYLNGDLSAHESILVDTGMREFLDLSVHVYKNAVDKVDVFKPLSRSFGTYSAGLHGVAEKSESYTVLVPKLQIGKNYFINVKTHTTTDYTSRIGTEVLEYGVMTLDFINKRFYFDSYEKNDVIDISSKTWPLLLSMNDKKMVVGIVWDETLKEKVNVGDEVIKFGRYNYEEMDFCEKFRAPINNLNDEERIILKDVNTGQIKEFHISKI